MKTIYDFIPSVIFYHYPCPDGFGAYSIAHKKLSEWPVNLDDIHFIPYDHKDEIPTSIVRDKNVLMIDCCFPRKKLEKLKSIAKDVYILDHHKGAQDECKDLEYCHFDLSKSGIRLSWEFFFPDDHIPAIVYYIEDRDLHVKKYLESNYFCAYVDQLAYDLNKWQSLFRVHIGSSECHEIILKGRVYNDHHTKLTNDFVALAFPANVLGHNILVANVPKPYSSSVPVTLIGENPTIPFAMAFTIEHIPSFKTLGARLSFRSKEFDLIPLTKQLGGGGHPNAAGAIVKLETLMSLIGAPFIENECVQGIISLLTINNHMAPEEINRRVDLAKLALNNLKK